MPNGAAGSQPKMVVEGATKFYATQSGSVHALDNVVVADSSVFVTSSGYGPTLTLVALAARAAHHLAGTKPG